MQQLLQGVYDVWMTIRSGGFPDLGIWSYVLLALLAATEGPFTVLIGAAAAAGGYLDVRLVYLAAVIGNITGDVFWYTVGFRGNSGIFYRYGSWLGVKRHHVERLEAEVRQHAIKLIVMAKVTISFMIPTLVAAGLARVHWRKWLPTVLLIETIWTTVLVTLGYHGADVVARFERSLRTVGIGVLILAVIGIFWYARRVIQRSEEHAVAVAAGLSNQTTPPSTGAESQAERNETPGRYPPVVAVARPITPDQPLHFSAPGGADVLAHTLPSQLPLPALVTSGSRSPLQPPGVRVLPHGVPALAPNRPGQL
jgi:membrane-associated protein